MVLLQTQHNTYMRIQNIHVHTHTHTHTCMQQASVDFISSGGDTTQRLIGLESDEASGFSTDSRLLSVTEILPPPSLRLSLMLLFTPSFPLSPAPCHSSSVACNQQPVAACECVCGCVWKKTLNLNRTYFICIASISIRANGGAGQR